jgi:hypothetical protein
MGSQDTHSTTSQQASSGFGTATTPTVNGILGQLNPLIANSGTTAPETTAINQLTANGQAGNPYAAAEGTNATNLLAGGGATSQNPALTANMDTLKGTLAPYTDPNYSTVDSPAVARAMQAAHATTGNAINGQFAAAGRSGSGANADTLARGFESVDAPLLLNQANQDTATRMGAANTLYGAGNTTSGAITGNNQTANGNMVAGSTAATGALNANDWGAQHTIAAQELGKTIPATDLGMLTQIGAPLIGSNLTTNQSGTTNQSTSPSLLQDITGIGGMLGSGAGKTAAGAVSGGSGVLGLLGML